MTQSDENDEEPLDWGVEWGASLKQARLQAEKTQLSLADAVSVSQPTISHWERGSGCPSEKQRETIEKFLGARLLDSGAPSDTEPATDLALWLKQSLASKQAEGKTIGTIASESGVSVPTLYNILNATVAAPQPRTLTKLQDYFGQVPAEVAEEAKAARDVGRLGAFSQFDPYDESSWPVEPGVYILYDISDRPIYVGKSRNSVASRLRDHQTRFWYKRPLVTHAAYIAVGDPELVLAIETLLIKVLRSMAVVNQKGVVRDQLDDD